MRSTPKPKQTYPNLFKELLRLKYLQDYNIILKQNGEFKEAAVCQKNKPN